VTTASTIIVLSGRYAVCRLPAAAVVPDWATGEVASITRTATELSIVCYEGAVPNGVRCEPGYRCLRVAGTLDFSEVGILASLLGPLANASVPVLALSTFDTDYLFVKEIDLETTVGALRAAGHQVQHGSSWP